MTPADPAAPDSPLTTLTADSGAVISSCGTYRYELFRRWAAGPQLAWIMLNPSTADATVDDPTIRRCIGFARAWGYGAIVVWNLFALRATDPRDLGQHPDPVGPANDLTLLNGVRRRELTICAWGAHGSFLGRGQTVRQLIAREGLRVHHLGLTKSGHPRHPLYLPGSTTPQEYKP